MKLMNIKKSEKTLTRNFNQGGYVVDLFATPEEKALWYSSDKENIIPKVNGCYTYEVNVTEYMHTYEIEVTNAYLEKVLPLRHMLGIIKKLSNRGDKGAMSKQLVSYYTKAGTSKMMPDFRSLYTRREKTDLSDKNNRKRFVTNYSLLLNGELMEHGVSDGRDGIDVQFEFVCTKHMRRCLAILIEKGYLTVTKETKNKGFRRSGRSYTYHYTYYKLTDKAEAYLKRA